MPLPRRPSADLARLPANLRSAVAAAGRAIDETGAEVVVGFGGYVSTPAYLAARRRGVPIVVHEQNARAGIANRLGSRFTRYVATTFASTALRGAQVVGMPLRREIALLDRQAHRTEGLERFGLDPQWPTLLVTGGSLGAQRLNTAFQARVDELRSAGVQVLHITGLGKEFEPVSEVAGPPYVVAAFADRMDLAYAAADLVVARAGANTVCELTAVGLPAVYVPLPIGNGEQRFNAVDVVAAGGGLLVDDSAVTPEWIDRELIPLLGEGARLQAMAQAAASVGERGGDEKLADMVCAAYAESRQGHAVNGHNSRFDFRTPVPELSELGAVHFVAIGGAGMSGVARVMLARGCRVSGSDAKDSPVLTALAAEGATVSVGHDPSHLDGVDTVVISSAVRESNPELAAARERGLRVLHRSQALASTMSTSRRVAVAGANGKTTTTSMLTVALQHCGADPSFAAGGELAKHGTNAHWGTGEVFVAEADESDGSFLVYRPEVGVVTNVQPDHLDFYGTFENVQKAYAEFAASILDGGLLVACHDDEGSLALAERARSDGLRVLTYGVVARRRCRPGGARLAGADEPGDRPRCRGHQPHAADHDPGPAQPAQRRGGVHGSDGRPGTGPLPDPRGPLRLHRDPPPVRAQGCGSGRERGRRLRPQPREGRRGRGHGRRARARAGTPSRGLPAAPVLAYPGLRARVRRRPGTG